MPWDKTFEIPKVKLIHDKILLVHFKDSVEMSKMFFRPQEYLESRKFSKCKFTVKEFVSQFKDIESDYFDTIRGMNMPGCCIMAMHETGWGHKTPREKWMLNKISKYFKNDDFYVIVSSESEGDETETLSTILHEVAHALWSIDEKYRNDMYKLVKALPTGARNVRRWLKRIGYSKHVYDDEVHAYLSIPTEAEYVAKEWGINLDKYRPYMTRMWKVFNEALKRNDIKL